MNKARQAALEEIRAAVAVLKDQLDDLKCEEEEYRENMPERLAGGERGEAADSAISALDTASENLDEAMAAIEESIA